MKIRSLTAAGLVLAVLFALGVGAAPASASTLAGATGVVPAAVPSDIAGDLAARDAARLEAYRVMVNAEQLTAAGGGTERGAWSAQKGAMAAKDAARYSVRATVGLEQGLGSLEVIRPYPAGQLLAPTWRNKVPMPRYTGLGLSNPSSLLLIPATAGWQYRGAMADGVLSFAQMSSADDTVCAQQFASAGFTGFVNWLTQQDCTAWQAKQDFVPNLGMVPRPAGWQQYPINWGAGDYPGGYYSVFLNEQAITSAQSGTFTISDIYGDLREQNIGPYSGWCRTASDGSIRRIGITGSTRYNDTAPRVLSYQCSAGETLYAFDLSDFGANTAYNTGSPDYFPDDRLQRFWFSAASPKFKQGTEADPVRSRECIQTGSDGLTYTGTTPEFRESEIAANGWPAPSCAPLPVGVTSQSMRIVEKAAGYPDRILVEQQADATPDTDALLGGNAAQYCQEKVCVLDLVIKSSGLTCFSQGETCLGWWDEAAHGDAKYQCNYAGFNVAIADCALYSHIFDTQKRLAGNPYSDPVTGEEVGAQTGTSVDGLMMNGVPRASFSGRDCFGSGYGAANPLQWVLRPLQCFGEWAAVPRTSVVESAAIHNTDAYAGKLPAVLPDILASWKFFPPTNGCGGIPVDVFFLGPPFYIMDACPGTMLATMAGWSRLFCNLSITVLGVLALTRYAGKTFGYTGLGSGSGS